ncbi:MAG: hypothetical protein WAX89_02570 [Alphaproteobacteria bacterium]
MAIVLFSSHGIHYAGGGSKNIQAIYVPTADKLRVLTDLSGDKPTEIAERYGAKDKQPLWRSYNSRVTVYGILPDELADKREEVSVYLAQDFIPQGQDGFFFVLGQEWIVHGLRSRNDEGVVEWGVSRIEVTGQESVKVLLGLLSERMLAGADETYGVAVSGNDKALEELKIELKPYHIKVERLETLKPVKGIKPLYQQKNFSFWMLVTASLALLLVIGAALYWGVNNRARVSKDEAVEAEQLKIQSIELNKRIGDIRNPKDILSRMSKSMSLPPSSLLNSAAAAGKAMGTLARITFKVEDEADIQRIENEKFIVVDVFLKNVTNTYLVDQEKLATSLLEDMPWIKNVKYVSQGVNRVDEAWLQLTMRVE